MAAREGHNPQAAPAADQAAPGRWLAEARAAATERLARMGLPGRRDEYWRFTDPATLTSDTPVPAAVHDASDEPPVFDGIDRLELVFTDGRFDAEASDPLALEGIEIARLAEAGRADIHWAQGVFGVLEAAAHDPVPRPLAALNTARAGDGVLIRVGATPDRPVSIACRHAETGSDAFLHHVVEVAPGAEFVLLEHGAGAARLNTVLEVRLGAGAVFHHIRAQGRDHERRAATHIFADIGQRARFKSFTLTANGRLTRNETLLRLKGAEASAHVAAAVVGDGADFHHDDTVFIAHEAPHCESRQVFKKVLRNGATGVFQGKILVRPGAQKTDGYQKSQGLLLDGDSNFFAKPELEIYADDVACSHGATVGAVDEEALFYLTSRGVPRGLAQDMLVLAFLGEAIDEIADARIAEDMRARLEGWLARHHR